MRNTVRRRGLYLAILWHLVLIIPGIFFGYWGPIIAQMLFWVVIGIIVILATIFGAIVLGRWIWEDM